MRQRGWKVVLQVIQRAQHTHEIFALAHSATLAAASPRLICSSAMRNSPFFALACDSLCPWPLYGSVPLRELVRPLEMEGAVDPRALRVLDVRFALHAAAPIVPLDVGASALLRPLLLLSWLVSSSLSLPVSTSLRQHRRQHVFPA
eukprot:CAMPEP_0115836398 /NCGR_PEP_ID=MMETSP0287-20121206/4686_1 /TAXON_ID=412157 /ORGANISM="Chrysochromulina rotalis, Strain UIO044" /LENGTH=145 /DNA_ID=CAMNT_0003289879 /DNA_START=344 /DNA_END=782 /DNA_ORIENTATION=+